VREATEVDGVRAAIQAFIAERLASKLDKLKPDEEETRRKLKAAHEPKSWLADAARRVTQLQLATHTVKPIHPDARGTNIRVSAETPCAADIVGTHSLPADRQMDVVGNAAALDVYKFLSIPHEGRSLLQRLLDRDSATMAALSDDPAEADALRAAFASIAECDSAPESHELAKQVYFPVDGGYHLLAPLFPTTLVHHIQQIIREHRFGEASKAARDARRNGRPWAHGYCEYPDLAIRKLGGSKPQNISQLNSERYGENWLLASKPPVWVQLRVKPPFRADSVFDRWFGRRGPVRGAVARLREFLRSSDHNNHAIRNARARLVADICDEVHQYAASLQVLKPGWSADPECRLHQAERFWLDPLRARTDEEFMKLRESVDWRDQVSSRFANWLNSSLETDGLVFDQYSAAHWADVLRQELKMFREVLDDER
jgi:CRISPR-associated protein Csy1